MSKVAKRRASRPAPRTEAASDRRRPDAAPPPEVKPKPTPEEINVALDGPGPEERVGELVEHPLSKLHALTYDLGCAWLLADKIEGPVAHQLSFLIHHTRSRLQDIHRTLTASPAPERTAPRPGEEPPCSAAALVDFLDELDAFQEDIRTTKLALDASEPEDVESIAMTLWRLNERFFTVKREFLTKEVRL